MLILKDIGHINFTVFRFLEQGKVKVEFLFGVLNNTVDSGGGKEYSRNSERIFKRQEISVLLKEITSISEVSGRLLEGVSLVRPATSTMAGGRISISTGEAPPEIFTKEVVDALIRAKGVGARIEISTGPVLIRDGTGDNPAMRLKKDGVADVRHRKARMGATNLWVVETSVYPDRAVREYVYPAADSLGYGRYEDSAGFDDPKDSQIFAEDVARSFKFWWGNSYSGPPGEQIPQIRPLLVESGGLDQFIEKMDDPEVDIAYAYMSGDQIMARPEAKGVFCYYK